MTPEYQAMVPQALQLLENRPLRNFRVDVAADSLVQIDEAEEKKGRMEFLEAFGGFMQQALPVVQSAPQLAGMVAELMKFGVGAFKGARQIEGALDQALSQLKQQQQAGAAQPKPPSEEQLKAQAEMQKAQMQAKAEQDKLAANLQIEAGKLQVERERIAAEMQIEREKIAAENERADREFRMKLAHDAEQAAADRAARAAAPIQKAA
jgi:vacuolar-type H+-ATPase subunit I/STV1